jgi:TonB family protein
MVAAPQAAAGLVPTTLYSANTLLVIDAVTVSDKNGRKIERLSAGDFLIAEDGMAQVVDICEFQNLPDRPYYILGYYTRNHNADGKFRKIGITLKGDATARLEYRAGYYGFSPDTARLIGVGNSDAVTAGPHPVLMHKKAPEYSEEARKAKYQGTVILNLEIDASGRVANVSVTRSLGLGLDEKATDAVKQWTFRPAMKDGKPVTVHAQVAANFRLL